MKNRGGLGSTKTAYSTNYHDFHSQSLTNVTHVYSGGDRSQILRRLHASEFNLKLPAIEYKDPETSIKAIEYFTQKATPYRAQSMQSSVYAKQGLHVDEAA